MGPRARSDLDQVAEQARSSRGETARRSAANASDVRRDDSELVDAVLEAYRRGWFPMADLDQPAEPIGWYEPERRGLIPLRLEHEPPPDGNLFDGPARPILEVGRAFHVPARLRTRLRTCPFILTTDRSFERVMVECADPGRDGGWIDGRIIGLFTRLHHLGYAHSVEVWLPPEDRRSPLGFDLARAGAIDPGAEPPEGSLLVGGLYGLRVDGCFAGESMFSRPVLGGTDASKLALCATVAHLRATGFGLFDCQMWSEHHDRFGCVEVTGERFRSMLAAVADRSPRW
ncbi:MAG: leucyl/phenylalanyl-tRNA--protein transferase [Planctomycetota bacterium]